MRCAGPILTASTNEADHKEGSFAAVSMTGGRQAEFAILIEIQ
jgi:hypothetical protein